MKWSWKIASIEGTEIKIHVTFVLLLGFMALSQWIAAGFGAAMAGTLFILMLFACVLLHEMGHVFAARVFGVHTPDITLLPIGGVARLERMPRNPFQELVIAIAGPLVNVAIAAVMFMIVGARVGIGAGGWTDPSVGFFAKLATINLWLVLFNLIPAFPMDGGRVLRASLAFFLPYESATRFAASLGKFMAVVFAIAGFLWNPMLLFIAVFVYFAASQEAWMVQRGSAPPDNAFAPGARIFGTASPVRPTIETRSPEEEACPVFDEYGRMIGWTVPKSRRKPYWNRIWFNERFERPSQPRYPW